MELLSLHCKETPAQDGIFKFEPICTHCSNDSSTSRVMFDWEAGHDLVEQIHQGSHCEEVTVADKPKIHNNCDETTV